MQTGRGCRGQRGRLRAHERNGPEERRTLKRTSGVIEEVVAHRRGERDTTRRKTAVTAPAGTRQLELGPCTPPPQPRGEASSGTDRRTSVPARKPPPQTAAVDSRQRRGPEPPAVRVTASFGSAPDPELNAPVTVVSPSSITLHRAPPLHPPGTREVRSGTGWRRERRPADRDRLSRAQGRWCARRECHRRAAADSRERGSAPERRRQRLKRSGHDRARAGASTRRPTGENRSGAGSACSETLGRQETRSRLGAVDSVRSLTTDGA